MVPFHKPCYCFCMEQYPIQQKSLPEALLRELGVAVVYLFGSQAEGIAGPMSDIDIGIVYADADSNSLNRNRGELYQALYNIFTDVFDMRGFREIDIIMLDRAPLELRFDVITHGTVIFETDPELRSDFEERTAALYRDFKPLREESNRAVLQRV